MSASPAPELLQRADGRDLSAALDALAAISQDFAVSADLDQTLRQGLQRILDYMDAEAASIFLLDDTGEELACPVCLGPVDVTHVTVRRGQGIVGRAVATGQVQMVRDVRTDRDFHGDSDALTGFVTRSILCAPLQVKATTIGALEVINRRSADGLFDASDRNLLQALASVAALAIHNARMAAALVGQERMKKELELAREIQARLLPFPGGPDAALHGVNLPVSEVSGDFFDHFTLRDGRLYFGIGDVSGKGMNAALLMAKTIALFRALGKGEPSPGRLLRVLNDELLETSSHGMFVTMAAGVYDPAAGQVVLANAGHQPPLLRDPGGGYRELEAEDPPLGILACEAFAETRFALDGASLYLFTDGLTEARVGRQPFGVEGIEAAIEGLAALPPATRVSALAGAVDASGAKRHDDVTVLLLERPVAGTWRVRLDQRFSADAGSLASIREAVRQACAEAGCTGDAAEGIVLAANEACMNSIQHGYRLAPGEVLRVQVIERGAEMLLRVLDRAPRFAECDLKPRPLDDIRPGGLGVHFMRETMDGLRCLPPPPGFNNLLEMSKRWK